MDDFAIKVEDVSKVFKLPHEKNTSLKSTVVNFYRPKRRYEIQKALSNVSFEIKKGEFFGIVGRNGSGKSTLLKLLAGIYAPTKGEVHVRGSLTPFIELGVGFNPELTGRENVYLNGALLGFNRKEMNLMYSSIVEFAELEKFMDQKLKNYSSGMQVRLAFSIAIRGKSEIILIDEVLAVGDAAFQKKCLDVFRDMKREGRTVVLVTHDMSNVEKFCDKALVLHDGEIITVAPPLEVATLYSRLNITSSGSDGTQARWGKGGITIEKVVVKSETSKGSVFMPGDEIDITVQIKRNQEHKETPIVVGLAFYNEDNINIAGPNTQGSKIGFIESNVTYKLPKNPFNPGKHKLTVAVYDEKITEPFDFHDRNYSFDIASDSMSYGLVRLTGGWSK